MNLLQLAAPTAWAVTLPDVQAHVRSTESAEAAYLSALIKNAQSAIEGRYGIALSEQSWKLTLDEWPTANAGRIYLPRPPLIEITEVKYVGDAGTEVELAVGTGYQVDSGSWPARLYPPADGSWPSPKAGVPSPVRIKYKAGFKDGVTVLPLAVSQAMLLLISFWYENREASGGEFATVDEWRPIDSLLGSLRPQMTFNQ
jgi:uncharacterized phiE125 gp8 family phage protein